MPRGPDRMRSATMTGLLMAVAAALIVTGIIMFVAIGSRSAPRSAPLPESVIDIGQAPTAPGPVQDIKAGVPPSGAARLQFADKNNPTRLQSEMAFEKLDPVGNGYYSLSSPRAWVYMKDGRTLYITAAAGRVKMPGRAQQPESGEFTGGVVIRLFAPPSKEQPDRPVDPETDAPGMLATTQTLAFDTALLELSTDDRVTISTPSLLFRGQGLLVRGNEVKERIEFLKTRGEIVRYNPKAAPAKPKHETTLASAEPPAPAAPPAPVYSMGLSVDSSNKAKPAPATATPTAAKTPVEPPGTEQTAALPASAPAAAPSPARETLYKAVAAGQVRLVNSSRTLAADTLEIWSRVLDNRLPENAFGPLEFIGAAADAERTASAADSSVSEAKSPTKSGGRASPKRDNPAVDAAPALAASVSPPDVGPGEMPPIFVTAGTDDVVLTWNGPLVLAPLATSPSEPLPEQLDNGNHFAARFSAERAEGQTFVTMIDSDSGTTAACGSIEYLATSRQLRLLSGSGTNWVMMSAPGAGRFLAPRVQMDLGIGLGHVEGGGSLVALRTDAGSSAPEPTAADLQPPATPARQAALDPSLERRISWSDQADFQFRRVGGKLTSLLEWASFTGSVLAHDHASVITGDFLRAEFAAPAPGASLKADNSALRKLLVEGNVLAVAGSGKPDWLLARNAGPTVDPFVRSDSLEVSFAPAKDGSSDVEPTFATAKADSPNADREGDALRAAEVGNADAKLAASKIEARFGRDDKGNLTAVDVVASSPAGSGLAKFEQRDGTLASADRIRADGRARTAELTGQSVLLARGPSRITGTKVRLDEARGMLIIDGEGTFEHLQADDAPVQFVDASQDSPSGASGSKPVSATRILASWVKGMSFDNQRGEITCEGLGSVVATSPFAMQTLKSDRLILNITPEPPDTGTPAESEALAARPHSAADSSIDFDGRRLLRAEAIGSTVARADGQNASVELRRYARGPDTSTAALAADPSAAAPGRILEQVMYIEGPRILSDEVALTMSVPGAGRAIVRDQRPDGNASPSNPDSPPDGPPSPRGTTGFSWAESLDFNRATGVMSMKKEVELVHVTLDGQQKTRLVGNQLAATFSAARGHGATSASAPGAGQSDLQSAEAAGAVYAESGTVRLMTDRFRYDARTNTAEAQAEAGNRVTLYDDRKPTPIVARKLLWDLGRDRVEVTEPAPMVAPR